MSCKSDQCAWKKLVTPSLVSCAVLLADYLLVARFSSDLWHRSLRYLTGYAAAVILGHCMVKLVTETCWYKWHPREKPNKSAAAVVGFIERTLYVACLSAGLPAFIAVWLGLKLMGEWKILPPGCGKIEDKGPQSTGGNEKQNADSETHGSVGLNLLLVGSGLSLAYGGLGAYTINWLSSGDLWRLLTVTVALVAATVALYVYISCAKGRARAG